MLGHRRKLLSQMFPNQVCSFVANHCEGDWGVKKKCCGGDIRHQENLDLRKSNGISSPLTSSATHHVLTLPHQQLPVPQHFCRFFSSFSYLVSGSAVSDLGTSGPVLPVYNPGSASGKGRAAPLLPALHQGRVCKGPKLLLLQQ